MIHRKEEKHWSGEHIQRFWDWWATNPNLQNTYFSKQVGKGITKLLKMTGKLDLNLLDYGSGPGYLLENILKEKIECNGLDYSTETVKLQNEKFKNIPYWKGARKINDFVSPFGDEKYKVITVIEMIEHLKEENISKVLKDIRRLLRSDGVAFITVPNKEIIENNMIYCPFCNSEFHRVQHLRSLSEQTLRELLELNGFNVLFCRGINLDEFQKKKNNWRDYSYRLFRSFLGDKIRRIKFMFSKKRDYNSYLFYKHYINPRHLCAIVEKR